MAGGRPWTAKEDKLLRTLPIAEAARRTGRTLRAVYARRAVLGWQKLRRWTPTEDELVRTLLPAEVARLTGRLAGFTTGA